jgi:ubiquinone biosynthesis protein
LSLCRGALAGCTFFFYAADFFVWRITFGRADDDARILRLARNYTRAARYLRGGYIKVGQLLATRSDLLSEAAVAQLRTLQEQVPLQFASAEIGKVLRMLDRQAPGEISQIEASPIGSGSIAQVHIAHLKNGRKAALKIKSPGCARRIETDARIACFLARGAARLPALSSIPVNETMDRIALALRQQVDFPREIATTKRFANEFAGDESVIFPEVDTGLSNERIIATSYFENLYRFDEVHVPLEIYRRAATSALRVLFKMIFCFGHIHCDLHPGNLKYDERGVAVFLDCGFVAEIDEIDRQDFIDFFLSVALNKGEHAADVMRRKAVRVPTSFDYCAFEREVLALVREFSGKTAGDFDVARLVGELFALQQRFDLYSTPNFSMIIIAILSVEGVIRKNLPDLDFQAIAIDVLLDRPNWRPC